MPHEKRVRDLMIPIEEYETVTADSLVGDAVALLDEALDKPGARRSLLVVDENGDAMGILTLRGLIKAIEPRFSDPDLLPHSISWIIEDAKPRTYPEGFFTQRSRQEATKRVREVLEKKELITVEAEAPLLKAVHLMLRHNVGRLPVLERGRLVGMIRLNEIFREIARVVRSLNDD